MDKLLELAERVQKAEASEQRELLERAYEAVHGSSLSRDVIGAVDVVERNGGRANRFRRMLDAGAYESAALTLKPEGWGWSLCDEQGQGAATVSPNRDMGDQYSSHAATPALALLAAICRARAASPVTDKGG